MTEQKEYAVKDDQNLMNEREYRITVGAATYWITEEERDQYLTKRAQLGVDYVALREGQLVVPAKFEDIVHKSVIEESNKINKDISNRSTTVKGGAQN